MLTKAAVKPNHLEIEKIHVDKIVKQMSTINAGLINWQKLKNHTAFSARFDGQDEDHQALDEIEL